VVTSAWISTSNPDVLALPYHEAGEIIRPHAMHTGELRKQGIIGRTAKSPYTCIDGVDCGVEVHRRIHFGGFHFYHKTGTGSTCTGESRRHRQTQNVVLQFLDSDPRVEETRNNKKVGTKEADGYVRFVTGEEFYLEVVHTHHPDPSVVDLFGEKMLVLDLGYHGNKNTSDEDVYNDLAPAYFAQEVLAHYENVRRIKDADSLDHRLFQLYWKLSRGRSRYNADIRRCYSTPLLEQDVDHGYVCLNCDNRRYLDEGVIWVNTDWVTEWSERETKSSPKFGNKCNCDISDVQWSWNLDGTATHEIATGIELTEVDISGWADKDAVKEELLKLEHLRFHIRMGNQTRQRTWEKTMAVEDHTKVPFVPRTDFHFPPLRHDFRCCHILKSVRASVHGKIGSGKSIDPQESEEDLQREIDAYHQKVVEYNGDALEMVDASVANELRNRFGDRWGILDADRDKLASIPRRNMPL
ncbi:uncharacterized protein METZ01_LOCUS224541, partial [marine metagenome]